MNRPDSMQAYEERDLKLGIKSSLPHVKGTAALAILLWECAGHPAELVYSKQVGNETVLTDELEEEIKASLSDICVEQNISKDALISKINENQLFKSQLEALIVAFELIWKIAKVGFEDTSKAANAERTGGVRYAKRISFSLNMDVIHCTIDGNRKEYLKLLLSWVGFDIAANETLDSNLSRLLTALSEEAVFKLVDGKTDVIFNENSIYKKLLETEEPVDINGDKEAKGSLRILKSLLNDGMNPYLQCSGGKVTSSENDKRHLLSYQERVDTFLQLSSTKVIGLNDAESDVDDTPDDEYHRAAKTLTDHISEAGLVFDDRADDVNEVRQKLIDRFSPEKLASLPDDELLTTMFYSSKSDNSSLCYFLEFNKNSRELFGSISGGSSYKFILFQDKKDGQWTTGSGQKPDKLTEERALELGKQLRDYLVNGAEIIKNAKLDTPEDYETLDNDLMALTDGKCTFAWVHKYFSMLFPDKLTPYHSDDWQKHILYALRIKPSPTYYGRDGQISIVRKLAGLNYVSFYQIFEDRFGGVKTFLRLGTTDNEGNHFAEELRRDSAVGIGWNKVGSLSDYITGSSINKQALTDALKEKYYSDDSQSGVASRKAGELMTFYNAGSNTVFVAMDGERILAFVDNIGENYFEGEKALGHRHQGKWHLYFDNDEVLPNQTEGHLTSCYEIKKEENLTFLYERYYYGKEEGGDEYMNLGKPFTEPVYHTGLDTGFSLNRIIFGAPGTGKSYGLEQDRKKILQEDENNPKIHIGGYERVTFHPDYTYSQFVGTYKPVSEGKEIYYKFVPGPFMRIFVNAIENGKSDNPQPYVLLVEEINRAPVAAVFGDIFQLLDRDDDGSSQYEIEASEDIRGYLADKLGGDPDDYEKIKIPDNMYIWATMNSADQGVFPMDTAFKRRWDFTYLGVDENDEDIRGKFVVVGDPEKEQQRIEWNSLRKAINEWLAKEKINEDKQLGPYFISRSIVVPENGGTEIDSGKFCETFKNKVLMYLFEDAARQRRDRLFEGAVKDIGGRHDRINTNRYSEVCAAFDAQGIGIFNSDIQNMVNVKDLAHNGYSQTDPDGASEE